MEGFMSLAALGLQVMVPALEPEEDEDCSECGHWPCECDSTLARCEKCDCLTEEAALDENGYCAECVQGNLDWEDRYRYFHSVSR